MEDLANVLAIEIKQEIAQRYFGFRRKIEREKEDYLDLINLKLPEQSLLANSIADDLNQIRALLGNEAAFSRFQALTTLDMDSLRNGQLTSFSPKEADSSGETTSAPIGPRFAKKLWLNKKLREIYGKLFTNITKYCDLQNELLEVHSDICSDIKSFYRNNDIGGILDFIRQIDNPDTNHANIFQTENSIGATSSLTEEMLISPPVALSEKIVLLPMIPSLNSIKSELKELAESALA